MVSQIPNRCKESICNFQLSRILKFGSKSPEITKRGKIFTSHFCSFVSHFIFVQPDYISLREKKIKVQFFCFSWLLIHYTALSILFGFLNAFLVIWVFSANLSSFWALTFQSYIFQSSFWPFPCVFPSFVQIFWPLDFIRELLWDALDAHSLNVQKFI